MRMHNELMTIKDNIRVHNACADPKKKSRRGGCSDGYLSLPGDLRHINFGNFLMFI